jgi:hypothetical protein
MKMSSKDDFEGFRPGTEISPVIVPVRKNRFVSDTEGGIDCERGVEVQRKIFISVNYADSTLCGAENF